MIAEVEECLKCWFKAVRLLRIEEVRMVASLEKVG